MKKLSHLLMCIAMVVMAASCGGDVKYSGLLDQVPANVDMVVAGDVEDVIISLGGSVDGSKVELPSYLTKELKGNDLKELNELTSFLARSGVNISACAAIVDFQLEQTVLLVELDDAQKFQALVSELKFVKSNADSDPDQGVAIYKKSEVSEYYTDIQYLAIKDNYAYVMDNVWSESKAAQSLNLLKNLMTDAENHSVADTKFARYMMSDNTAGAMIRIPAQLKAELIKEGCPTEVAEQFSGVICMKGGLSADEINMTMKWYGEDGREKDIEPLKAYFDPSAKVNSKALSFMSEEILCVTASTLKGFNWDKMMNTLEQSARLSNSERSTMALVKSYLQKIDGTVAYGIGFGGGVESFAKMDRKESEVLKNMVLTVVCEVVSGKEQGLLNDFRKLLNDQNVPFESVENGLNVAMPEAMGNVYLKVVDNYIVLSNKPVQEYNNCPVVKNNTLSKYFYAAVACLPKTHQLMKDLGVKYDVSAVMGVDIQSQELTMKVKFEGEDEVGVAGKIAKMIIGLIHQEEAIESKYKSAAYDDDFEYSENADFGEEGDYNEEWDNEALLTPEEFAEW